MDFVGIEIEPFSIASYSIHSIWFSICELQNELSNKKSQLLSREKLTFKENGAFPVMMIVITVLGFLLIEEGFNEILNPRRANK
jgi:hypothetical protein